MNHLPRPRPRPRPRLWRPGRRAVTASVAVAVAACLAACGGGTSSSGSANSTGAAGATSAAGSGGSSSSSGPASASLLSFSQCMRSHGVPDFPDPEPSGDAKFPSARQLGVSDSQYHTSENACQQLLPAGANDVFPPAEVQQLLIGMRGFSQCVRSRGEPNWPDPTVDSQGRPLFPLGSRGISRDQYHSSQVQASISQCQHLLPAALGGGTPVG